MGARWPAKAPLIQFARAAFQAVGQPMSLVAQPTTWRRHLELTLIIACYLVLGAMYSVATPIFEASDEIWHYPYVKLIAGGEGLPVQKPRSEDNVGRQGGRHPPPHYA